MNPNPAPPKLQPVSKIITFHVPNDPAWVAAFGEIAIRHAHVDYSLRLMIKTLANLSVTDALDATAREGSAELRGQIRKLGKQRLGVGEPFLKLKALLKRCERATTRRNDLLHALCAADIDGADPQLRTDTDVRPLPSIEELSDLSRDLTALTNELNRERLTGWLDKALNPNKVAATIRTGG